MRNLDWFVALESCKHAGDTHILDGAATTSSPSSSPTLEAAVHRSGPLSSASFHTFVKTEGTTFKSGEAKQSKQKKSPVICATNVKKQEKKTVCVC